MPDRYDAIILGGGHDGLTGDACRARAATIHPRAICDPHGLRQRA